MSEVWKGGGIPYGYIYDDTTKTLMHHPHESNILKDIFSLVLENKGPTLIANKFNSIGLKTRRGKKWSSNTIFQILSPERLKFYRGYDKNGLRGNWEPLLSEEEYRSIFESRGEQLVHAKSTEIKLKEIFLLSKIGIFFCGYCDGKIKSSVTVKEESRRNYYCCASKQRFGISSCPNARLHPMGDIDSVVLRDLRTRISRETIDSKIRDVRNAKKERIGNILEISDQLNNFLKSNLQIDPEKTMNEYEILSKKIEEAWVDYKSIEPPYFSYDSSDQDLVKANIAKITLKNNSIVIRYKFPIEFHNLFEVQYEL